MKATKIGLSLSTFWLDWKYFSNVSTVIFFDILTIYLLPPQPKIIRKICPTNNLKNKNKELNLGLLKKLKCGIDNKMQ
jgi:hypothetical protein